jgi:hypothetical protein
MSFWTENSLDPKRAYRFRVANENGLGIGSEPKAWWNVKRVDKPSYTVNTNQYQIINHKVNIPGIVTWNPITIEIADVGRSIQELLKDLQTFGYSPEDLSKDKGLSKGSQYTLKSFVIEQFDGNGKFLERWFLDGAFISDFKLSQLDYSSDEIITITLTITYDYAKFTEK